jgi:hypothetical protein
MTEVNCTFKLRLGGYEVVALCRKPRLYPATVPLPAQA